MIPDASVVCKWYFDEPGAGAARVILLAGDLIAPDSLVAEFTNAVSKRTRRGLLTPEDAARIMAHMPRQFARWFPAIALAGRALEMSIALNHPSYDCLYLALAERKREKLVTDDIRFHNKVAQSEWRELIAALRGTENSPA